MIYTQLIKIFLKKEKKHYKLMLNMFSKNNNFLQNILFVPIYVILVTIFHYLFAVTHFIFETFLYFFNREQFVENIKNIDKS